MKRPLLLILPLALAAAFGHAHAATDNGACRVRPVAGLDPAAVQQAGERLAAVRGPSGNPLALADALSGLALASVRQSGRPDLDSGGQPAPTELVRQAIAIWNAAGPDPKLARAVQERGLDFFNIGQCGLGREVLEAALRLSGGAARPDDQAGMRIVEDLLRVALAMRDDASIRRLAPQVTTALEAAARPLDPTETQMLVTLVEYFALQPEDRQDDYRLAEQFAQRALALLPADVPSAARRLLSWRLVSIYYAELRYADAEALRARLLAGQPAPAMRKDEFAQQREALAVLVRKGDLNGAQALARTTLEARQQAYYATGQAVGDAEFALAQARQNAATAPATLADLARRSAQAHARENLEKIRLAQTRSYLGEILHAMGDLDGAAAAYRQALEGFPVAGYMRSLDRAHTRGALAILYRTRGDYASALPLQQQVLDELLPALGEAHPDVQEARKELALLRKLAGGAAR